MRFLSDYLCLSVFLCILFTKCLHVSWRSCPSICMFKLKKYEMDFNEICSGGPTFKVFRNKSSRYSRLATNWTVWGSNSGRGKSFSLFQNIQTGSGANPASYPVGTGDLSWHKVPGAKVNM